jgi:AraC family transcriptional regulator
MKRSWSVEHQLAAGDLSFEVRRFHLPSPHEMISEMQEPILGLVIDRMPLAEMRPSAFRSRAPFRTLGRLTFSPPQIPYDARGEGGEIQVASFNVAPRLFELLMRDFDWDERRLLACVDVSAPRIDAALMQLAQEAVSPGFASDVFLEGASAMIVVELARYLRAEKSGELSEGRFFTTGELSRIEEIIDNDGSVTLETIASECGMAVRTLTRVFKATTGKTIREAIADRRVRRAMKLLKDPSLPLKVIAFQTSFSSASSFASAFRRETGMTPGAYRRQWTGARSLGVTH